MDGIGRGIGCATAEFWLFAYLTLISRNTNYKSIKDMLAGSLNSGGKLSHDFLDKPLSGQVEIDRPLLIHIPLI